MFIWRAYAVSCILGTDPWSLAFVLQINGVPSRMTPRCQAYRPAHVKELSSRDNYVILIWTPRSFYCNFTIPITCVPAHSQATFCSGRNVNDPIIFIPSSSMPVYIRPILASVGRKNREVNVMARVSCCHSVDRWHHSSRIAHSLCCIRILQIIRGGGLS